MLTVLVIIAVFLFISYIFQSVVKPKNFPPGPKWYPFIGCSNVTQKMDKIHGSQYKGLSELAKMYSTNVLGLKLGTELLVIVYGSKNVKQVLHENEFDGRPWNFFIKLRCFGKRLGITFTDGPFWKIHRQFTLKQLKNVGFGKTFMEKEIQNKLHDITAFIKLNNDKPINPKGLLATAVMNILWKYVAGETIEEKQLEQLLELFSKRSKAFSMAGGLLNQIPWSRFVLPKISGYSLILQINQQISNIIGEAIQKHKVKMVERNDFIYSFLEEMEKGTNGYCEEQLKIVCLDLFIAGSQTSSSSLEFALQAALRYPHMQQKIYEEIKQVIGDETPCWTDSNRLIHTHAFIMEVQRYFNIAPLIGPRRVLEDTVIDGYNIPKETTVLVSVGDLHFDPELWSDPQEFQPKRFIDENGQIKYVDNFYPFGDGRRRCPGDSLAKSFIFITFVGILQKFRIEGVKGIPPPDKPAFGLLVSPSPYSINFMKRY